MVTKRFKKSSGKTPKKQDKEAVVHLSGDEDDDVTKFVERTEYKDRIPEDLELDLMESRTTAENLSKNVMIFADYDSDDSEEEDKKSKNNLLSSGDVKESCNNEQDAKAKTIKEYSDSDMDINNSLIEINNIDPTIKKYVDYMTCLDNLKPIFEHFLSKLSEESRLHKLMAYYNLLCNQMSCLIIFHLFKFNDGKIFDMTKEEVEKINIVMIFMDVLCDKYPEIEQIISLLEDETENKDVLKDMYETLNKVDCEEVYLLMENVKDSSKKDGSELDYSDDEQLSTDSEDNEEDKQLLRELKNRKNVENDDEVTENRVERRLDQAIIDNKGIAPSSKKKKKTPGVKRRQQFQKASIRNRSSVPGFRKEIPKHEGEVRGIKKNVVKSRKF